MKKTLWTTATILAIGTGTFVIVKNTGGPPPFTVSIRTLSQEVVSVTWSNGGTGPFQLQVKGSFSAPWTNLGLVTMRRQATLAATNPAAFFRVQQQVPLLSGVYSNPVVRLTWSTPELSMPDSMDSFLLERSDDGGLNFFTRATLAGNVSAFDDNHTPNPTSIYRLTGTTVAETVVPYNTLALTANTPGATVYGRKFGGVNYYDTANVTAVCKTASGVAVAMNWENTVDLGSGNSPSGAGMLVMKYDLNHAPVWGSPAYFNCTGARRITGICVDGSGHVYVCGYFGTTLTGPGGLSVTSLGLDDAFVAKFDGSNGNRLWFKRYGGVGTDRANGLCIDSQSGALVVVGQFLSVVDFGGGYELTSAGSADAFVLKLSTTDGATSWAVQYGGALDDRAFAVCPMTGGGVTVVGYMQSGAVTFGSITKTQLGPQDVWMLRMGVQGTTPSIAWVNNYGAANTFVFPTCVTASSDRIAMSGYFKGSFNLGGGTLTAPDATGIMVGQFQYGGAHIWSKAAGGQGQVNNDTAFGVATDSANSVFVIGRLRSGWDFGNGQFLSFNPLTVDPCLVKYDSNGFCKWANRYTTGNPGQGTDGDFGNCICMSPSGETVYAGGLYTDRLYVGGPPGAFNATPGSTEGFLIEVFR